LNNTQSTVFSHRSSESNLAHYASRSAKETLMTSELVSGGIRCRKTLAIFLLLLLLGSGLIGCHNQAEGLKLAETGIATADTMARYYDSLAQDTLDIWEWEAFSSAIRGTSFDDHQQQLLQDQVDALNHRSRLAHRLGSTYRALKELSSYNASGDVKSSAENLAKAIIGLPPLKGSSVNPSAIFGKLAEDIVSWKQSKDIRKGSELILRTLQRLVVLFDRESEAYKSIAEERGNKIENVIDYAIRNKIVLSLPLLQKAADTVGLKLAGADKPVDKEEAIVGLIAIASVRARRLAVMSAGAADGILQALEQLVTNHREFRANNGLSLSSALVGIERAQSYLEEIANLRSEQRR
jgi:hypothetical protein